MKDHTHKSIFCFHTVIFSILLSLGIFLRLYHMGYYDLWYDEAYSVMRATNIVRYISRIDSYMQAPLYYVLLHLIIRVFGNSEFVLRMPSALASILAIFILYRFIKSYYSTKLALIAVLLCAFSPFQLWYAQEARVYSIAFCMSLVLIGLYTSLHRKEGRCISDFLLLFFASVLALACHYFFIFVIIPMWACYIHTTKADKKIFFLYAIPGILIGTFPVYPIFMRQIIIVKDSFWLTPPGFTDFLYAISNSVFGYTVPVFYSLVGFFIISLLVIHWLIYAPKDIIYILNFFCGICPIIMLFLLSQYIPVFLPRALIVFVPFIIIIMAQSIFLIPWRFVKITSLIILCIFFSRGIVDFYAMKMPFDVKYHRGVLPKKQFRPISAAIQSKVEDSNNAVILHTVNNVFPPFLYYITDIYQIFLTVASEQTDLYAKKMHFYTADSLMYKTHKNKVAYKFSDIYLNDLTQIKELHTLLNPYDSIWLVRSGWHRDGSTTSHSDAIFSALKKQWQWIQKDSLYYDGIYLDHFKRYPNT